MKKKKRPVRGVPLFSFCLILFGFMVPLVFGKRPPPSASSFRSPSVPPVPSGLLSKDDLFRLPIDVTLRVYDPADGSFRVMPLEDYVYACVLAEMPSSFSPEALMAQAVACRSYAVYKAYHPDSVHPDADVCTSPSHCQSFLSDEETARLSEDSLARVREAVDATAGRILSYGGEPALCVYHASSGDYTFSSAEVWGGELPYLTAVSSPEGTYPDLASASTSTRRFSFDELRGALGLAAFFDDALRAPAVNRSSSGRVTSVDFGGMVCTGGELVRALSLRSADFSIGEEDDGLVFTVHGYGHGVGLSQCGAEAMAREGESYENILAHYYPGTHLVSLSEML